MSYFIGAAIYAWVFFMFGNMWGRCQEGKDWRRGAKILFFDSCTGCGERKCPLVGPWWARHRMHAYCPDCMPDLYQEHPL